MNYIREINAFYDWLETNKMSLSAIALWHALMHINNKAAWTDKFAVAVSVLCAKTGLSPRGVNDARNELKQKGRVIVETRKGNQSAIYQMISLSEPLQAIIADNRADNATDKCADNRATLNKQNKTKQKDNNPPAPQKKKYAEFVMMTEKEHETLVTKHGEPFVNRCIEVLDNAKGAKGYKYKSDYRAILSWVVERVNDERQKGVIPIGQSNRNLGNYNQQIRGPDAGKENPFPGYDRSKFEFPG